ncbi:MAG TPA: hypothetical protein VH170_05835 [Chthoniobacterales bacterium]|jgi:hypothetical protein|nr:hypothetical protein [Chthoniobacterales bacterium]
MRNIEAELRELLSKRWRKITLSDFKAAAERELNGSAFESIRTDSRTGRKRIFLIVCATGAHEIGLIEKSLDLQPDPELWLSWEDQSLFDLAFHTEMGVGLSYQDQRDANGKRTAIIICATRPASIRLLEQLFLLPE